MLRSIYVIWPVRLFQPQITSCKSSSLALLTAHGFWSKDGARIANLHEAEDGITSKRALGTNVLHTLVPQRKPLKLIHYAV